MTNRLSIALLEDTHTFPGTYMFKVIGKVENGFVARVVAAVRDVHRVVAEAGSRGLEVQFELGKKHGGTFTGDTVEALRARGQEWLDAGAVALVIEARESARGVGLFDPQGGFQAALADRPVVLQRRQQGQSGRQGYSLPWYRRTEIETSMASRDGT